MQYKLHDFVQRTHCLMNNVADYRFIEKTSLQMTLLKYLHE